MRLTNSIVHRRRLNEFTLREIGMDLLNVRWHDMYRFDDSQQQADFFYFSVTSIFDKHAPILPVKTRTNDKPWINDYFRSLVRQRNAAWKRGDRCLYRILRNRVNRVRLSLKTQFFIDRVEKLKGSNSRDWWKNIKKLGGMADDNCDSKYFTGIMDGDNTINPDQLPDAFNNFLVSLTEHISPLNSASVESIRNSLDIVPESFIISEYSVHNALSRVKIGKSVCDDVLTNRMLRQFADILAAPICALINTSFRTGIVPQQWKLARITPIPKVFPPLDLRSDLRPIAITSSIAKIAEFFIGQSFLMNILILLLMIISLDVLVTVPLLSHY